MRLFGGVETTGDRGEDPAGEFKRGLLGDPEAEALFVWARRRRAMAIRVRRTSSGDKASKVFLRNLMSCDTSTRACTRVG